MASVTGVGSNLEIVREYTRRAFNEHNPDLAFELHPTLARLADSGRQIKETSR